MLKLDKVSVTYSSGGFFQFQKNQNRAVEEADLVLEKGKILGLVGESGCGKSTLGRAILGLVPVSSGQILLEGHPIQDLSGSARRPFRKNIQVIFQDPYSSLNPRFTIEEALLEGLDVHFPKLNRVQKKELILETLHSVNLATDILHRYPHEFSGGQRQRIAIARALLLQPEYLICDEATSALDVSTQAQVINTLLDLRESKGLSYLFISHDLNLVDFLSDAIAIMYLGKIVEKGSKEEIRSNALHPYTKALFSASFRKENRKEPKTVLKGEIPSSLQKPKGCYFQTRCPLVSDICKETTPVLKQITPTHSVACHLVK